MRSPLATKPIGTGGYHLRFDALRPETGTGRGLTSFNASLDSSDKSTVDLAGLSGILIDLDRFEAGPLCVTIHEALTRHTSPRRATALAGAEARLDLQGGTDGRLGGVETRHALFLWLPEIHDEGAPGGGTRLLHALRAFLDLDVTVLLDLGVEDEQEGYVKIFYPRLQSMCMRLSETGQFAEGVWRRESPEPRPSREIGFVYL